MFDKVTWEEVLATYVEMSVRTEPRDLSQQLQSTLTIPADQMIAAAAMNQAGGAAPTAAPAAGEAALQEQHLHQANDFNTNSPDHPLKRTVVVNIRASLADLCLKASTATWAPPSQEATKAIFQQARPCPSRFEPLSGRCVPRRRRRNTRVWPIVEHRPVTYRYYYYYYY